MRILISILALPVVGLIVWLGAAGVTQGEREVINRAVATHRPFKVTIRKKGELKAANSIDIKCEVEGRSTIIWLVDEGAQVKEGDLLVELASDEIEERVESQRIEVANAQASWESAQKQLEILLDQNRSNIRKANLKLELAKLELEKYLEGEWIQQLEDAEFRVEEAKKVLDREAADLEAAKKLVKKDYITRTEYEQDVFDHYKAGVNYDKAKRDLKILKEYTHVKDLQQKESDVEEAGKELARIEKEAAAKEDEQRARVDARKSELDLKKQRLAKLEQQMSKTKIYAPADGLVVYGDGDSHRWYRNDNEIKEGAEIRERQTIMQLPDTSTMKVLVRIHEGKTDLIDEGQPAIIEVEGISEKVFTGRITKIAVLADSQNRWLNPELKEYETEITLNESHPLFKPGNTARAEILIEEREDVLTVPVQCVYTKGNHNYVFVGDTGRADFVEVGVGTSSTEWVEITSGLTAGQEVLLAVSDQDRRKLPEIEAPEMPPEVREARALRAQKDDRDRAEHRRGKGRRGRRGNSQS